MPKYIYKYIRYFDGLNTKEIVSVVNGWIDIIIKRLLDIFVAIYICEVSVIIIDLLANKIIMIVDKKRDYAL